MTANVTSLVTITTFLVRMLFRAIICKDGAADLRQYEACFQGFFFFICLVLYTYALWLSYPMINGVDHCLRQS